MDAIRRDVSRLRERYKVLQQQQFTFINALDNTRSDAYEKTKPLRSINQVKELFERSRNATDRRAMKQWLDLVGELTNVVMRISNINPDILKENPASQALDRCRTLLNPSNEFSALRAGYPHQEVNHLSCSEARVLYGGCVSIVPLVFDNLLKIYAIYRESMSELNETWPTQSQRPRSVQSARHQRSNTETQVNARAKTALGNRNDQKNRDKGTDTNDLSKRMLKLSFGKMPKGTDEPALFYRRTLNGRADKLNITGGEITLDKAPWRGASYDKINHVDHRRFVNLEGKFY
ncbi:sperm acrosome-associated protein 9-like [Diadema antillarum]|uniref:sperm acrosome-associated protein 9-like n=1 Tax=Diadema antillarum TaxID=105358 RepID=UPI003A898B70